MIRLLKSNGMQKNKKYYEEKGYIYTKMKDDFDVQVFDLSEGSDVSVNVKCDYCGVEYKKPWNHYLTENGKSIIHKDCCINCRKKKIRESVMRTYGETTVLKLQDVKDKVAETNLAKYGCVNPFSSDIVKKKIEETNMRKYGVKSPLQCDAILNKVSETCRKRYGVDYYIQTQHFVGAESPTWKGGVARERCERYVYDYIKWRKDVFIRDKYTCQCCNAKNGHGKKVNLNAHHIFNWADYPELRFDINNGITLCEDCHYNFHKLYGKRKVT